MDDEIERLVIGVRADTGGFARDVAAMRATLSCKELAEVTLGGALGRVLASLGAAIDRAACESHSDPQPLLESYDRTTNVVGLDGRRRPA